MRSVLHVAVLALPLSLFAQAPLHLIPMPREAKPGASLPLTNGIRVDCAQPCDPQDAFAVADFKATLAERHIPVTDAGNTPHIFVTRFNTSLGRQILHESSPVTANASAFPAEMHDEGYALVPDNDGIALTAETASGIFYALQTAKQLIEGDGSAATLHLATIRDWPAMKYRGLSDDLSRGPVDTLDFQKKIVRTLAAYKDNLYSPYFENTQQYASNPLPAPPGGGISAEDARQLVAYAAQFHVLVVPDQEAFGHLRHALIYEEYQPLAETPHGAVLAPGQPGSLKVIKDEFTELAHLYPGPFLHVGADETEDLGRGQTKAEVDARGLGPVYLDFIQQIDNTLHPLHRKLLFWGDIAEKSPELLKDLPAQFKQDTIAISWHYNAPGPNGFIKYINDFKSAGFDFWVAPGINNWSRVYPNYNAGLANIQVFTAEGQAAGATGQLNTIWYDDGEALASNNWYGILFGCASAWQKGESSIPQFEQSYSPVFHGDLTGKLNQAQLEIMAAHDLLKQSNLKGDGSDLLFWSDPWAPDNQKNFANVRPVLHDLRMHAEKALDLIAQARAAYPALKGTGFSPSVGSLNEGGALAPEGQALDPRYMLPSNPTSLREPDAIDAMELGARRLDFIGLKFQLADEMSQLYAQALSTAASGDRHAKPSVPALLSDINGVNGRIQDIKDGYSTLRDLYQQLWLRTNRPYALRPVLEHYDYTIGIWLARMDKLRAAQRTWEATHTLPTAAETGIPVPTY
ncbi:family 20 glycosylhydrolase [Granulicella sp. 5B5]|nr:family 20 glycosylhydrolase [Granulicella sp. 5B5]